MDHLVYISASAAAEAMLAQAANSHNLANASTPGFRADLILAQEARETNSVLHSRAYTGMQNSGFDFREGVSNTTGRDLDIAVQGQGWMAVQGPDGGESYTRRGDLRINELGQVMNGAGQMLLGNSGPIALPPFSSVSIGDDGTISIVPAGENPSTLAVVDRVKLVNPARDLLSKSEDGTIRMSGGEVAAPDANVRLLSGELEGSNVNSVAAMVRMIELARGFENHIKMTKIAEQLDAASTELMQLS